MFPDVVSDVEDVRLGWECVRDSVASAVIDALSSTVNVPFVGVIRRVGNDGVGDIVMLKLSVASPVMVTLPVVVSEYCNDIESVRSADTVPVKVSDSEP